MDASPGTRKPDLVRYVIVAVVLIVVVVAVAYFAYGVSQQPNIQVTNLQIGSPQDNPRFTIVQSQGRVSTSGSFSYISNVNGVVYLEFDNTFSIFSTKQVTLSYTAAGTSHSNSFSVPPGQVQPVPIPLSTGQSVSGTFSVSGGSGNDINFYIEQYTCSQIVPFSFVLVNSGSANGYGTVVLTIGNGTQVFSNKYYVQQGQQLPESGNATIADCAAHTLTPSVTQAKG